MGSRIPQLDLIKYHRFYSLYERNWKIDCSKESIKSNKPILESIASDFSYEFGLEYVDIMKAFGNYVCGRSSDSILMIYTQNFDRNIYYYLTNTISDVYEQLNSESENL